eukprot:Skav228423  [mRNA]  locus=scaffold1325:267313:272607:+ [translate_table: standard]
MDSLPPENRHILLSLLRKFSVHKQLCSCNHDRSFLLQLEDKVVMGTDVVRATVRIVNEDLGFTRSDFMGHSLQSCSCMDVIGEQVCELTMTAVQWDLVASQHKRFLAIAAKCFNGKIDTTRDSSTILPVMPTQQDDESNEVMVGELFAGGIGGWSFAIKALNSEQRIINTAWALDQDPIARKNYQMNHGMDYVATSAEQCWGYVQADQKANLCPTMFFQTQVENLWWLPHVTRFASQLILMSPPCPAWSAADSSPGLCRADGMCLVVVIVILAFLRPRAWGLENVSTLKGHKHWEIVLAVVKWTGFRVQRTKSLDLLDQTPQHRERLLMYAINMLDNDICGHRPVSWPLKQKNTLRSCHVICELDEPFRSMTVLSDEDMALYLDVRNMPHDITKDHKKRNVRELVAYRLRTWDDSFACVMTTYGRPEAVGEFLISKGGLYGSLFQNGNEVRKLSPPEICVLFGIVDDLWLPTEEYIAVSLLGNSISPQHAMILLLNMTVCIRPFWFVRGVDMLFSQCMSDHINASNMRIEHTESGYWIKRRTEADDTLPTMPIHDFAVLSIRTPMHSCRACVEEGLNVATILQHVLGSSMPSKLEIAIAGTNNIRIQLHSEVTMPTGRLELLASVPSCFLPSDVDMKATSWPCVAVMTPQDVVIITRQKHMKVEDVLQCLMTNVHHDHKDGTCHDVFGLPIDEHAEIPNVVFFHQAVDTSYMVATLPDGCRWEQKSHSMIMHLSPDSLPVVECNMRRTGMMEFIMCLGWEIHTVWTQGECQKGAAITLMPTDGKLAVQKNAVVNLMTIKFLQGELSQLEIKEGGKIPLKVSLWGSCIWDRACAPDTTGNDVVKCWENAARFAGNHHAMTVDLNGDQVDLTIPIMDHATKLGQAYHMSYQPDGQLRKIANTDVDAQQTKMTQVDPHAAFEGSTREHVLCSMMKNFLESLGDRRMPDEIFEGFSIIKDVSFMMVTNNLKSIIKLMKFFHNIGIERILHEIGWQLTLNMSEYQEDMNTETQMRIVPMSNRKKIPMEMVHAFLHSAVFCVRLPVPMRKCDQETRYIQIKLKFLDKWVLEGKFDAGLPCAIFNQPWHDVSTKMEDDSHMRMVSRGKMLVDERKLGDIIDEDRYPSDELRIHFVLQLRGGGFQTPKPDAVTTTKNDLARLFLQLGCELQETSQTVEKLVQLNGIAAIKHALRMREPADKLSQLERLARTNGLTLPSYHVSELKRNNANQQRQNKQKIKTREVVVSDYKLATGVFKNQDGTDCQILDQIKHAASGVMLSSRAQAEPWLQHTSKISQDELGILIMGCCDNPDALGCTKHSIPANTVDGSPVIIAGCLHQLGNKNVEVVNPKGAEVALEDSTVVAVTVYRDELDGQTWKEVTKSPVKGALELLAKSQITVSMLASPWGRTWANEHGKCTPDQAKSFQFHMRVWTSALESILRSSGSFGTYCTPKTENRETSSEYMIIWLDADLQTLKVKAAACQFGMGIVRVTKGKAERTSRGIRVKSANYAEAHKILKPGIEVPSQVNVRYMAKISPLPNGATQESIKAWLTKLNIAAKPLKPLGPKSWMIGRENKFDDQWLTWNTCVVLVTWLQEKAQPKNAPIVAGRMPKHEPVAAGDKSETLLSEDPWQTYIANNQGKTNVARPAAASVSTAATARIVEGPIEERFKAHDQRFEQLQKSMEAMSSRMDSQDMQQKKFEGDVRTQITDIQTEVTKQISSLTASLEDSVTKAMRKQDKQLGDSMQELKALLTSEGTPSKRHKAAAEAHQED